MPLQGFSLSECRRERLRQLASIPECAPLQRLDRARHVVVEHGVELS